MNDPTAPLGAWMVDEVAVEAACVDLGCPAPVVAYQPSGSLHICAFAAVADAPHGYLLIQPARVDEELRAEDTPGAAKIGGRDGLIWHELVHAVQFHEGRLPSPTITSIVMLIAGEQATTEAAVDYYHSAPWEQEAFLAQVRGYDEPLTYDEPAAGVPAEPGLDR